MKWNQLQGESGSWLFYLLIGISYFLLSIAVKRVPIAIAFASWEGAGLLLISALSFFLFGEQLSILQLLGVGLAGIGILLVNMEHS